MLPLLLYHSAGAVSRRRKNMEEIKVQLPRMRTIRAAAAESGLAEYFIRQLIKQRKIVYVTAGCKYLINFDSLCEYLRCGERGRQDEQN